MWDPHYCDFCCSAPKHPKQAWCLNCTKARHTWKFNRDKRAHGANCKMFNQESYGYLVSIHHDSKVAVMTPGLYCKDCEIPEEFLQGSESDESASTEDGASTASPPGTPATSVVGSAASADKPVGSGHEATNGVRREDDDEEWLITL